jgi:hypothetical protein
LSISLTDGGSYEYIFLCVDTSVDGWWDNVFGNSYTINAPLGESCDFIPNDEWANYGFTVNGADVSVAYCAGTCDATCPANDPCGDGTCADDEDCSTCPADCGDCETYSANFSIDLNGSGYPNADYDQCGVNGSWNGWGGWGLVLGDDDGDGVYTGSLEGLADGNYEYVVFCSGAADGWSGWGVVFNAPLGSDCDLFDNTDEFGNYGFTVAGADVDAATCAGTCDATCEEEVVCEPGTGDVNFDDYINVTVPNILPTILTISVTFI